MAYFYLALAIISEVIGTVALKASEDFTKLIPSIVVFVGFGLGFYFLVIVIRTIPIGITYAIWSGVGIVLVTLLSAVIYRQIPDLAAILGIFFIILGVVVIHLFSNNMSI